MSNPAVVVLSSEKVGTYNVTIEDNIGEALHLHMDDIRIDFSYLEFKCMVQLTKQIVDSIVSIENFSCEDYDPVFLSTIMPWLLDLEIVKEDKIYLGDILVNQPKFYKHVNLRPITSSKDYKALEGDFTDIEQYNSSNHIKQSGRERLFSILESLQKNGYPYKGKKIVFFNDSNVIRDGQHRAAAMLYLYGNIEVPIKRLCFIDDKYSYYNIQKNHYSMLKKRKYLCNYCKMRLLNLLKSLNKYRVDKWNKSNIQLINEYNRIDK